jgi:hypothetical protein
MGGASCSWVEREARGPDFTPRKIQIAAATTANKINKRSMMGGFLASDPAV